MTCLCMCLITSIFYQIHLSYPGNNYEPNELLVAKTSGNSSFVCKIMVIVFTLKNYQEK